MLYDESRSRPDAVLDHHAQPQLAIASSVSAVETGHPSSPASAMRSAAPCVTRTAVSPGPRRARTSRRGRHDPLGNLLEGLGSGDVHVRVHVPGQGRIGAETLGELLAGQSGALPHVVLAQPGVLHGSQPGGLLQEGRGLASTGQVAAHEQHRVEVGQRGRHRLGLATAAVVEADVGVALGPALGVPGRLAVPREDQAPTRSTRRRQRPRPEVTSAGSGITGQSRHSRSSA